MTHNVDFYRRIDALPDDIIHLLRADFNVVKRRDYYVFKISRTDPRYSMLTKLFKNIMMNSITYTYHHPYHPPECCSYHPSKGRTHTPPKGRPYDRGMRFGAMELDAGLQPTKDHYISGQINTCTHIFQKRYRRSIFISNDMIEYEIHSQLYMYNWHKWTYFRDGAEIYTNHYDVCERLSLSLRK